MQKYVVLEKAVGETPLQCAEAWRSSRSNLELQNTPLAYAGRLDPMASGKLLVLIGDECKAQAQYHSLDKEYEFEVLLSVASDTSDVLGLLSYEQPAAVMAADLKRAIKGLVGNVELPYPHFSSKTVQGKPLHIWTLEGRLDEIDIPTKQSTIYSLQLTDLRTESAEAIYKTASTKIETIAPVTEASKALGNDFRRPDVRASWQDFMEHTSGQKFQIATFTCIASSGTYMRTLASVIAKEVNTIGLAYSIHRTKIGDYQPLPLGLGFWKKKFR